MYFAFSDIFESCDHSERRCLPTARRTYEDHELLVIDGDVGIRDCSHIAFVHLSNTFSSTLPWILLSRGVCYIKDSLR